MCIIFENGTIVHLHVYIKNKQIYYDVSDATCFQYIHEDGVTCVGDIANTDSKNRIKDLLRRTSIY